MRRLGVLVALVTASCAGPTAARHEAPAERSDEPAVRAARAEAEAADAVRGEGAVLRAAELRARIPVVAPLAPPTTSQGLRLAARLSLDSPFAGAEGRRAADATSVAAWANLSRVAADRREQLCLAGVVAGRLDEQRRLSVEGLALVAPLQAPLVADPEQHAAYAQLLRFRLRARPRPPLDDAPLPLPLLAEAVRPLDRRAETIAALVKEAPGAGEELHLARAEEARADEALHEALPRLGYVEAGIEPGAVDVLAGTVARVGVEIPLHGFSAEAASERRGVAARAQAEASARERHTRAAGALSTLARFEENGPDLRALDEAAQLAERLAREGLAAGTLAAPDALARLVGAFAARETILDARAEAGEARCLLESATGRAPAAWPRRP